MNFKNKLNNFMQNRYGSDSLNNFIFALIIILILINIFVKYKVLSASSTVLMIYAYYRMFSRDIPRRYAENKKFLETFSPVLSLLSSKKRRFDNRKVYKYIKCPNCNLEMKVPRGKGKLLVKCKRCNEKFNVKS